jgi:hypothetical protein
MTTSPIKVAKPTLKKMRHGLKSCRTCTCPRSARAVSKEHGGTSRKLHTRYRLSHHSMVVMFPNHWCATSWQTVLATLCFFAMSSLSGSRQSVSGSPMISP